MTAAPGARVRDCRPAFVHPCCPTWYRRRATGPRAAASRRMYTSGVAGDRQPPACCNSATLAPAAASSRALPTRNECPPMRPATPVTATTRLRTIFRMLSAPSAAALLWPPRRTRRNSGPAVCPPRCSAWSRPRAGRSCSP